MKDLKTLWKTFSLGDSLTTPELKRLAESAQTGLDYLQARGERLAAAKTAQDLNSIEGYLQARARG